MNTSRLRLLSYPEASRDELAPFLTPDKPTHEPINPESLLLALPDELLSKIILELDHQSAIAFALTCKKLYAATANTQGSLDPQLKNSHSFFTPEWEPSLFNKKLSHLELRKALKSLLQDQAPSHISPLSCTPMKLKVSLSIASLITITPSLACYVLALRDNPVISLKMAVIINGIAVTIGGALGLLALTTHEHPWYPRLLANYEQLNTQPDRQEEYEQNCRDLRKLSLN